jgi:hypothetical protein
MSITPGQMKLLQTARRKLALDEDVWRAVLVKCAGVASARELTRDDFDSVLALLRHLGFDPVTPNGASYGNRPGFASQGQVELIRELWREYCRADAYDEATLNKWLAAKWHVASLRFLTAGAAPKVITALKAMKARPRNAA